MAATPTESTSCRSDTSPEALHHSVGCILLSKLVGIVHGLLVVAFAAMPDSVVARIQDKVTCGAMGITRPANDPNRRRRHNVTCVSNMQNVEDWAKQLSRASRRIILNKVDETFSSGTISVTSISPHELGPAHFSVIYAHQRRLVSQPLALLRAWLRFTTAMMMPGTIDCYFTIEGQLVAWAHLIAKGQTLRAMWFYQRPEAEKSNIWFETARTAVARAISTPGVHWVDLGPSRTEAMDRFKARYGFPPSAQWNTSDCCCYNGPFRHVAARHELRDSPGTQS